MLILELAILSEQKIAKVIQLLEELRRDNPNIHDRRDPEAETMSRAAAIRPQRDDGQTGYHAGAMNSGTILTPNQRRPSRIGRND